MNPTASVDLNFDLGVGCGAYARGLQAGGPEIMVSTFARAPGDLADRGYTEAGLLIPRSQSGALITDAAAVRVLRMVEGGAIITASGQSLPTAIRSICVHGDFCPRGFHRPGGARPDRGCWRDARALPTVSAAESTPIGASGLLDARRAGHGFRSGPSTWSRRSRHGGRSGRCCTNQCRVNQSCARPSRPIYWSGSASSAASPTAAPDARHARTVPSAESVG